MSRCFPFPPPGYLRNGTHNEALIESIKLQKEMEKTKKDRKKEKKEKKEKKKEKKERRKEKKESKLKETMSSHGSDDKKLKHIAELNEIRAADGKLRKGEDCESEQLERSGITEEHDQPVSSRELCCLSDSTQSSKRKRSASPSSHDHGTGIRIRLPLRKHREPEQSKLGDQLGSSDSSSLGTSGNDHQLQRVTNAESNHSLGNSNSRHHKASQNFVHGDALVRNNKQEDKRQKMASLYDTLLQIPLTCEGLDSVGEDWLFRSDLAEAKPISKKVKPASDTSLCSTTSLWPRAQYIPEVEIYALPYTVPF